MMISFAIGSFLPFAARNSAISLSRPALRCLACFLKDVVDYLLEFLQ